MNDPIITPEITMAFVRMFMRMTAEDKDTAISSAREVIKPIVTNGGTGLYSGALEYSDAEPQPVVYGAVGAGDPGVGKLPARDTHSHPFDPAVSGDLSGNLPNPVVLKINGVEITNVPSALDDILVITSLSPLEAEWQPTIIADPTVGGDLSGTLPNPTVAKINGVEITNSPTNIDDILVVTSLIPLEAEWQANPDVLAELFTTKGDIAVATGPGTYTRLPVPPSSGYFLVSDPIAATGVRWIPRTAEMATAVLAGADNVLVGTDRVILE